jgi:hypothetical protein
MMPIFRKGHWGTEGLNNPFKALSQKVGDPGYKPDNVAPDK